jgi:hypothetical protein
VKGVWNNCEGCDALEITKEWSGCKINAKDLEDGLFAGSSNCWHPVGTALIWNEEITEIAHGIVCVSPSTTTGCGSVKNQPLAQTSKKCQ